MKNRENVILPPYDTALISEKIKDEEIKEIPGALNWNKNEVDPITFSVVMSRLDGIMSEMTATIISTARNPILYGAKDFSCTILDEHARVLSMHDCIPVHVGTMHFPLRFIIRMFPDDINEGDVFVNNASYAGNAHVGDWTMYCPIFFKGKFVVWAASKCHLVDNGAYVPSNVDPLAKDIYEEAIHFPGVKLCKNHEPIPEMVRFMGYNFRYSRQWYGDFLAQLGSLWVAESRVIDLCERFGYDVVRNCFAEALVHGDKIMTQEIKKLPKITVEEQMLGEAFENFCPEGLDLKMKLSIDPDEALITIDYSEMPDQLDWGYNLTYATCTSSARQGTLPMLSSDLPTNDGVLEHIKVIMRDGSMIGNPTWPVGTSAATIGICDETTNLVFKTWAKAIPERGLAGLGEYNAANGFGSGIDKRTGEGYTHTYYLAASGGGATEGYDGLPHMFGHCIMGNMGYEFIETFELATPLIVWDTYPVPDSGGAGKWMGGVGVAHKVQPRDHEKLLIYFGCGHTCAAFGLFGGEPGAVARHHIIDCETGEIVEHLPNAGHSPCGPNQMWEAMTGGGGGFGDPLERDPDAVRHDARDGFITLKAAKEKYGVVLNTEPELFEVDYKETEKLRENIRKNR